MTKSSNVQGSLIGSRSRLPYSPWPFWQQGDTDPYPEGGGGPVKEILG